MNTHELYQKLELSPVIAAAKNEQRNWRLRINSES
jgi:hypothetical protein